MLVYIKYPTRIYKEKEKEKMLKKLNPSIIISSLSIIIFTIIKTLVLIEFCESTRETRSAEFILLLIFATFYVSSIRNLINKKTEKLASDMGEMEKFIDAASIVSKADKNGNITYVNDKFTKVSGYTLEEVIGKNHSIVNSGHHPKEFWKGMYKVTIKEKGIWNGIVTNKNKNGELYYVDTFIKANFEDDKLAGFTSIRQDVTELKKKEIEIRNRMNAINRSNAVIEFDMGGNVMYANNLFCDIMKYKQEDIVGKHHSMFVEPEYKKSQEYIEFWEKLREGNFVTGECTRVKSDGSIVWLQSSYNPIIGFDGKPYKIMKICQDVTEKVLQSKEIEKKNTYLEHAAKILRHDMHSGINTYIPRGMSSLDRRLSDEEVHNLKIEAPLRMIREGLKHAQKVYKGVYEFTNLVKKDVLLSKAECNIKGILNDYLSSTSYKSQVLLDDNLPTIEVNEALFCTSVDNLIRNGLKYNDSDSKFVKIYSEVIDGNNYIMVEDNGRGIDQKDFEHLSKPYVRKEGQKETGTGLGLNICKAILDEHGFEITAEKLEEGGTKLKIKYD
jgi:PAS domain S-box-containing protein